MAFYYFPKSMEKLISYLMKLPGVGPKTAQRLAFHLLYAPESDALGLAEAIKEARAKVKRCQNCSNLTDEAYCPICIDATRDAKSICVVEQPGDVIVMEKTGEYKGLYHVLHGSLSPLEGRGPKELTVDLLMKRLAEGGVSEVIMATNTGVEGEATAMYLARLIKPLGIKTTRLAHGVPVGGDLEYTDELTLARAFVGRKDL